MKKIRFTAVAVLLVLTVSALAACGRKNGSGNNNSNTNTTTQSTTQAATQPTTGAAGNESDSTMGGQENQNGQGTTGNERGGSGTSGMEESTGVIDGLMNDAERGVNDLVGDMEGGTRGTDESRNMDESTGR